MRHIRSGDLDGGVDHDDDAVCAERSGRDPYGSAHSFALPCTVYTSTFLAQIKEECEPSSTFDYVGVLCVLISIGGIKCISRILRNSGNVPPTAWWCWVAASLEEKKKKKK